MKFRAVCRPCGFTYLELLFVVGLIGVAAAAAIPTMTNAVRRNRVFTTTELVAAQVRNARLAAITRNATFRVVFDCADGGIRYLAVTGVPAIDNSLDRCTTPQPNDGPPTYLPPGVTVGGPEVSFGGPGTPALEINGRGQISTVDGSPMPRSLSVTYGSHTRTLVVTATGRISTPAS